MKILANWIKTISKSKAKQHQLLSVEQGEGAQQPIRPTSSQPQYEIGPGPTKLPIVLFYISCICCVLGTIMLVHSFFYVKEEDKTQVLSLGASLSLMGVGLAIIMNVLMKREHDRIVAYVNRKAEEMQNDPNSRQTFNKEFEFHTNKNGPNGHH